MESFDPYCEWLGRPTGRLPKDHYELLGLARFEADLDLIAHTADTLRARIRRIRPGNHLAEWQRLLDRLEAAKTCLSDPIAKLAYDESIDTESHKVNVVGEPHVTDVSPAEAPDTAKMRSDVPLFIETPPVIPADDEESVAESAAVPMPAIQPSARQSRGNAVVIGALSALVALLAIASGYVVLTRTEMPDTVVNSPPGSNTILGSEPIDEVDSEKIRPDSSPADNPPAKSDGPALTPSVVGIDESNVPDPPPSIVPSEPLPDAPAPMAAIDPARQQAFWRSVASARTALQSRDLANAANHLSEAVSLAQTDEDLLETRRLEALRTHLDAFWGSLREQMAKLESGSELRVRETMVVVVEAGRDHLVVRASGRNHRYAVGEMPAVLVAALADQLFTKSSNAKALRASFLIVDPKGDTQQARQLLQEAAQGGAEVDELLAELNRKG